MEKFIEYIKAIAFILGIFILLALLINANEEKPHEVTIGGKKYIRSKEYVGDSKYQIILLPIDTIK